MCGTKYFNVDEYILTPFSIYIEIDNSINYIFDNFYDCFYIKNNRLYLKDELGWRNKFNRNKFNYIIRSFLKIYPKKMTIDEYKESLKTEIELKFI